MAGKGTLTVYFMGDAKALKKTIAQVKYTIGGIKNSFASAFSGLSGIISKVMGPLGLALGGGGVIAMLGHSVKALADAERVTRKLEKVLKSTGYAAGFSARQLEIMADKLADSSVYTDEEIRNVQTMLATFKNIGGTTFTETTQAVMDLSSVMGQDLRSSVVQLGKAMNDPVRGVTALRSIGVSFTEEQQKQIKNLVEQNRLADAQRIILDEMKSEFGGAAAAEADSLGGKIQMIKKEFVNFSEEMGRSISNALDVTGIMDDLRGAMLEMKQWATFSLPEWINTAKILGIELKFGFLKGWETGKAFFQAIIFSIISMVDNFKAAFTWISDNFGTLIKNFGTVWYEAWKGYIDYLVGRFKSVWEFIKDPGAETFKNMAEKNSDIGRLKAIKKTIDSISEKLQIQPPNWSDTKSGLKMILDEYGNTLSDLDAERESAINLFFNRQMEKVNAFKGTSGEKAPFAPGQAAAAAATKQAVEVVAAKFSGAAERGSLEAYKIEIGNQLNVQKKIESNTADAAESSSKMVDLLENINDNLERGEVFAF